jgi:hypothetical protein
MPVTRKSCLQNFLLFAQNAIGKSTNPTGLSISQTEKKLSAIPAENRITSISFLLPLMKITIIEVTAN